LRDKFDAAPSGTGFVRNGGRNGQLNFSTGPSLTPKIQSRPDSLGAFAEVS
jgi:hypothetical protein